MKLSSIFKTKTYYTGLALYTPGLIAVAVKLQDSLQANKVSHAILITVTAIALIVALYTLNDLFKKKELLKSANANEVDRILRLFGALMKTTKSQNIRSNIFGLDKTKKFYHITHQFNMEGDKDISIEIPENLGCTGEAWRTNQQFFCDDKTKFLKTGELRIPDEQAKKLRPDLEWICSTPIVSNATVIAVLSVDGNRMIEEDLKTIMQDLANRCSSLLAKLL